MTHYYAFRQLYINNLPIFLDIIILIGIEVYSILMYNNLKQIAENAGDNSQLW